MLVRLWAFLAVFIALPASASVDLPEQTKAATICIYTALKADPAVSGVDVYVPENEGVVIVYGFRSADGSEHQTEIAVSRLQSGVIRYAGSTPEANNPLNKMEALLARDCEAYGGYIDEVFITGPDDDPLRWHVDMAQHIKSKDQSPATSVTPALTCLYRLLKSDAYIRSVDVYSVNDFRFAIEFVFEDKEGREATADLMLSGSFYNVSLPLENPEHMGWDGLELLSKDFPDMDSKCHVSPALDNLQPRPRPRAEWHQVEMQVRKRPD